MNIIALILCIWAFLLGAGYQKVSMQNKMNNTFKHCANVIGANK